MSSQWIPIAKAPLDGTLVDIWAKAWQANSNTFVWNRFTDCRWNGQSWINVPLGYYAAYWMPITTGPLI